MNKGGWWTFDFGRVKMVNAVHSSSFPDGSYGGEPVGYVFDTPDGVLYVAGDTALHTDMQLIPQTCPPLDAAILPIGSNFTMDIHDAIIASGFIDCSRIIGCHYDSFGFIKIDQQDAWTAFAEKGKELILMGIGEKMDTSN
jgi:L-ascorbate metabolism protein UlaG (beta-lactamase superfamily)